MLGQDRTGQGRAGQVSNLSDIIFKSTQDTKRIDRKDVRIGQAVLSSVDRARIYLK